MLRRLASRLGATSRRAARRAPSWLRPRLPGARRGSPARLGYLVLLAAGAVLGALWALPIADVASRCPASGEGRVLCTIQKAYAASALQFLAVLLAAHFAGTLLFSKLPTAWRRWRAGYRPRRRRERPAGASALREDPLLRAAAWQRPGPDAPLAERVRTPRIVPVRSAPRRPEPGGDGE